MKRFMKFILLIVIIYISYQGWQKYLNPQSFIETVDQSDSKQSTINSEINHIVGSLQSKIQGLLTDTSENAVPASIAQVSDSDESIVEEIASHIQARTSSFVVDVYGGRDYISQSMDEWIDSALAEDDYIRYALQSYTYSILAYSQYSEVRFDFTFRETEEQTNYVRRFVKDLLAENQIEQLNDHEKIKWIHDWIVTHVQYDQSLTKYTAYEALTEKSAVCQGYALLGQMMLEEAGFDVRIAEGEVNTGNHAWNMVKLDNNWYHIDFTWDDPTGQAEDDVSYNYYLVSDTTLKKDHRWTKTYPTASTDYREVLRHAISSTTGEQQAQLKQFQKAIHLHWYEDEYTVRDKQALINKIVTSTKKKESETSFRYLATNTLIDDLNEAFKASNTSLSYNVRYQPLSEADDSVVTITIAYK